MSSAFKLISERRETARQEMVRNLLNLWETTDLHVNQLHKRTGIGYQRIRQCWTKQADNLKDAELLTLHSSIR